MGPRPEHARGAGAGGRSGQRTERAAVARALTVLVPWRAVGASARHAGVGAFLAPWRALGVVARREAFLAPWRALGA
eukprot:10686432-Lingulodinium_polyedra.AAC.1